MNYVQPIIAESEFKEAFKNYLIADLQHSFYWLERVPGTRKFADFIFRQRTISASDREIIYHW